MTLIWPYSREIVFKFTSADKLEFQSIVASRAHEQNTWCEEREVVDKTEKFILVIHKDT